MRNRTLLKTMGLFIVSLLSLSFAFAQTPGLIIRPAGGNGPTLLNPDGNSWSSKSSSEFQTNDISESEVPFKVVPPFYTEPTGDLKTGPDGGFTDIVRYVDGSGFYVYADANNLFFRFRISDVISGSKAYSALLDTDLTFGNSGPTPDTNYIAPSGGKMGNPGFEYEVVLETNFRVAVYKIDGAATPTLVVSYPLHPNSQISVAKSLDSNTPDYFYDFYVPLSSIGAPQFFRVVSGSKTAPSSLYQGQISDLYGIDDKTITSYDDAFRKIIEAQCGYSVPSLSTNTPLCPVCTAPPVVSSPVFTGTNVAITGTWSRYDATRVGTANIELYRQGTATPIGAFNALSSGGTWTITVPTVNAGDVFYAKAQATGESKCMQSSSVTAKNNCTVFPAAPTVSCATTRGMTGTVPLSTKVLIYGVTTSSPVPTTGTQYSTNLIYTNGTTSRTFDYFGANSTNGKACNGNADVWPIGTYMLIAQDTITGCSSAPLFICINGANTAFSALATDAAVTLNTPAYNYQTYVSGKGATSGQLLRLYINDVYTTSITASGSNFTFNNLTLKTGDQLKVYVQQTGTTCMTVTNTVAVTCYTFAPAISVGTSGKILSTATSITGTSSYPGASVTLYRGTTPSGVAVGSPVTVASNLTWSFTGLTLTAGESYYVTQASGGCSSPASTPVSIVAPTTVCPSFGSATYPETAPTIGGSIAGPFSGTIRLYLDGNLIGTQNLTSANSWSFNVNTDATNQLYPGAVLTATAEESGKGEGASCSSASVYCTPVSNPSVNPLSTTLSMGQTFDFTVAGTVSGALYSIVDDNYLSYTTSKFGSGSGFTLTTKAFNTPGTYNLKVLADPFKGSSCRGLTNITVTVNNVTLPVKFVTVAAKRNNNVLQVTFGVTNEQNIDRYEIERSANCTTFEKVGTIAYKASSSSVNEYSFADAATLPQACYRVKMIDKDGRYQYSKIVVTGSKSQVTAQLAPNPAVGTTTLSIAVTEEQTITVQLLDMNGRLMQTKKLVAKEGSNAISLDNLAQYAKGQYVVKVLTAQEQQFIKLLLQ